MMHFMLETILAAHLLGVDPFDQPAVESGKMLTRRYLAGEQSLGHQMAIRQLPPNLVNRIAAGEVVERPASVVKELIENAIDAGARRIDVAVSGGGLRLIRVSRRRLRHGRVDLALAVERHATSKLADDDLSSIMTLGFRGEALPSIGAVARLSIQSRAADAREAYEIAVDGGRKSSSSLPPWPRARESRCAICSTQRRRG